MELALSTSEEGKERLRNAKLRLDVHTAEMGMEMADAPTVPKEVRIEEPASTAPEGETNTEEANGDQAMDGDQAANIEEPIQTEQFNLSSDDDMADQQPTPMDQQSRPQKYTEVYIGTPDRPRVDKRRGSNTMGDDGKSRRFDSPTPAEIPSLLQTQRTQTQQTSPCGPMVNARPRFYGSCFVSGMATETGFTRAFHKI